MYVCIYIYIYMYMCIYIYIYLSPWFVLLVLQFAVVPLFALRPARLLYQLDFAPDMYAQSAY